MDFGKSPAQKQLVSQLDAYVDEELSGATHHWDDGENFPDDVYSDLVEMGLLGVNLPAAENVQDAPDDYERQDVLTTGMILEQVGKGSIAMGGFINAQILANTILYSFGDEEHQQIALDNANGENFLSFGLTEPEHGSDATGIQSVATRSGDEWVINGKKTAITASTFADYGLIYAKKEETDEIRVFVVPLDEDGVEVQEYPGIGSEMEGWGQIFLDDVAVPESAMVTDRNGLKIALDIFNYNRAWLTLVSIGGAQRTLDETKQYLREREAFGKSIAAYQGPQFQIAEWQTKLDCVRLKCYESLWMADNDIDNAKHSAMAKWFGSEVSLQAIKECSVLHGHYGMSKDFGIEERLRQVTSFLVGGGTPQIMKQTIAREELGREYLPY